MAQSQSRRHCKQEVLDLNLVSPLPDARSTPTGSLSGRVRKAGRSEQKFSQTMAPTDALRAGCCYSLMPSQRSSSSRPRLNTLSVIRKKVVRSLFTRRCNQAIRALVKRASRVALYVVTSTQVDLLRALIGVSNVASGPDWQPTPED